jgi:hypothetical protein
VASKFNIILSKAAELKIEPNVTIDARNWFRSEASRSTVNRESIFAEEVLKNNVKVGNMYFFKYDPKFKRELPYYDSYPLIFPFDKVRGGFLGINLHYLPLEERASLMDGLYDLVNNERYDSTTSLRLSYDVLKAYTKLKSYKPCVKHYLNRYVRSQFVLVQPNSWDTALFLPLQKFNKAPTSTVYRDSANKI